MGDNTSRGQIKDAGYYTDTASQLMQYYNSTGKQYDTSSKIDLLNELKANLQLAIDDLHKQYFEENPKVLREESIKRR